jgi:hypothetical protein
MEVPQIVLPKEGVPMLSLEHNQVRRNKVHGGRARVLQAIFHKSRKEKGKEGKVKQRETR